MLQKQEGWAFESTDCAKSARDLPERSPGSTARCNSEHSFVLHIQDTRSTLSWIVRTDRHCSCRTHARSRSGLRYLRGSVTYILCDLYWNKGHGVTAGGDRWKNNPSLTSRAPRAAIVHVEVRYIEPIDAVSTCQFSSESCRMHRASIQIYSYPNQTVTCKASRKVLVSLYWWMSDWKSCSVSLVSVVDSRSPQQ
jgi:hypothetical protein